MPTCNGGREERLLSALFKGVERAITPLGRRCPLLASLCQCVGSAIQVLADPPPGKGAVWERRGGADEKGHQREEGQPASISAQSVRPDDKPRRTDWVS